MIESGFVVSTIMPNSIIAVNFTHGKGALGSHWSWNVTEDGRGIYFMRTDK
jgi:hypothetical protein